MKTTKEEIESRAALYASPFRNVEEVFNLVKDAFTAGFHHGHAAAIEPPKTIREMRLKLKLTMKEVADACGTNTYYIPQIENGSKSLTGHGSTYKRVYEYLQNKLNEQK